MKAKLSPVDRPDLHFKIVQQITDLVNQSVDLQTILNGVVNTIATTLHIDVVSVYLHDSKKNELVLRANKGLTLNPKKPIHLKPSEGLTGSVFESKRTQVIMPASEDPRYKFFPESGEKKFDSFIGVPLLLKNQCLGVLVGQTPVKRFITSAEENIFQVISVRLAGVLDVIERLKRLKISSLGPQTSVYQGVSVSSGFAVGPVSLFLGSFNNTPIQDTQIENVEEEIERLDIAIRRSEKDLQGIIHAFEKEAVLSESEINIFYAHLMMLKDPSFQHSLMANIRENKRSAELAVSEEIEKIAKQFESKKDSYFHARSQDFRDIGDKILNYLLKSNGQEHFTLRIKPGSILVTHSVSPYLLTVLHKNKVGAIVTEKGGETSHTAILAKSLGIPAVCGIDHIASLLKPGNRLLVDGKTGFVFSNPDEQLIHEYEKTNRKQILFQEKIEKEGRLNTKIPIPLQLVANLGFPADVTIAKQNHLQNVGLFRSEFAFMQCNRWPTLTEQVSVYENIAKHFKSGSITIRTLDIGGDKNLPYFQFPKEENPLLGLRSIRFSMEYLDLFREQIKAILLTAKKGYRCRILLPMISHLWEVETAHEIITKLCVEVGLKTEEIPPLGIMMEVPATFFQLGDYSEFIDYISVGTNDLTQYLLAVDRNSNTIGHLYSGLHPAVLRMLSEIVLKAENLGKELNVCGELAGTLKGSLALMALGYKILGILPSRAPWILYLSKRLNTNILQTTRNRILSERKEIEIQRILSEVLESIDPALAAME
jgi:phosphotransferase system enzyme I (PtsP)